MKIIFISRYGSNNLGDQLIVREFEKMLYSFSNEILRFDNNLNYYQTYEEAFENNLQTNQVRKKNIKLFKNIYKNHIRTNTIVANIRDRINKNKALNNPNIETFKNKLKEADFLVIGGGNAIYDLEKYSNSAFYYKIIFNIALEFNIPIFMIGVGIGPFVTDRQRENTIESLELVDYITVRDKKSYEEIKVLNDKDKKLFRSVDPVLFLDNSKSETFNLNSDKVKCFGISVMDIRLSEYSHEEYEKYLDQLLEVVIYLINIDYKIDLFCSETADLVALEDLNKLIEQHNISLLKSINVHREVDMTMIKKVYNNIDALIGTRMHTLIIAFSQNIPFVGLNWQPKVLEFSKLVGLENFIVSMDIFFDHPKNTVKLIEKLLENYSSIKDKNVEKKEELKDYLYINYEIINSIINKLNE